VTAKAVSELDRLAGIIPPIVTPFDPVGEVSPVLFRQNIRRWLDEPISGFVLFGSNGEGQLLDEDEKIRLTAFARELVPSAMPLIGGVGGESTRAVIREGKKLADAGATYLLVSPPPYFGASLPGIAISEHYHRAADELPIPLLVYHIPKNTHVTIEAGLMAEIVRHPNIVGLKDSSGDVKRFADYSNACDKRCRMFVGNGSLLYTALELGAVGGIVGIGQIAPKMCAAIVEAQRQGDAQRAGSIQEKLVPVHREIVGAHGPVGTKAALDFLGFAGGKPRSPLRPLGDRERKRVEQVMQEAQLI
jgi:4-hydroxy-2-oxoglutarate aldolase